MQMRTKARRYLYGAAHEQFPPDDPLRQAVETAEAGFDGIACSDHFQPWWEPGESGIAWVWLGAVGQATRRVGRVAEREPARSRLAAARRPARGDGGGAGADPPALRRRARDTRRALPDEGGLPQHAAGAAAADLRLGFYPGAAQSGAPPAAMKDGAIKVVLE